MTRKKFTLTIKPPSQGITLILGEKKERETNTVSLWYMIIHVSRLQGVKASSDKEIGARQRHINVFYWWTVFWHHLKQHIIENSVSKILECNVFFFQVVSRKRYVPRNHMVNITVTYQEWWNGLDLVRCTRTVFAWSIHKFLATFTCSQNKR